MPVPLRRWGAVAVVVLCSGCATFRSYDDEMRSPLSLAAAGRPDAAAARLRKVNKGSNQDLLYYMELGELQRLGAHYGESNAAWLQADRQVRDWEARAKIDPTRTAGATLSYLLNDKVRPYEGEDYEKVMLTLRMAMNFLAQGDWNDARVAIRQTHERETVIAQVRDKQYQQIDQQAKREGAHTSVRELNGYPVQTIDNPEVNALRNSYQSAFSHYLAGFVYEAQGEASLAAAGYRQAIELRPSTTLLEDALAGLDERVAAPDDGRSDVLIAVETGMVPAKVSQQFPLPIPVNRRLVLVPVSFPVLREVERGRAPNALRVDDVALHPVPITNVDLMARRALQDEMPGIMLRGFVRSSAKALTQYQLQRQSDMRRRRRDGGEAVALDIAAIAVMLGSVVTESADERAWRSLPGSISIVRAKLSRGAHRISVPTAAGERSVEVEVNGRYAFVGLRVIGDQLYSMAPSPNALPAEHDGQRQHTAADAWAWSETTHYASSQ